MSVSPSPSPAASSAGSRRALLAAACLALSACTTMGDFGAYPPSTGYPSQAARQELQGAVRNVDHGNRRFLVDDDRGGSADIAYDQGTRLVYQGREQAVSGLEPGDRVRVLAVRDGGLWRAQDIQVIADARQGGGYGDYDSGMERRGAISRVDTRNRAIYYTEGGYSGGEQSVAYDGRTSVEYRGQQYRPEALERGDLVRIQLSRGERGWVADRILVEVSSRER
jgi:hypothetical protein